MPSVSSIPRTIELDEHDRSAPLDLSEEVLETIDSRINDSTTRLDYEYTSEGDVRLKTSSYVGLVSLPGGKQVRIRPKAAGGNFLRLLLYAQGATTATIDSSVEALEGDLFLDAIGTLFLERLRHLIRQGLRKSYLQTRSREEYLRGRLDVQRQLSRGNPVATRFDVEYQELTHDIIENRAILYATHLLTSLVGERSLQNALRQREQQLRREIPLQPVRVEELDTVHLDRLSAHYENIIPLARLVIQSTFVDNLQSGTRETYGILLNMNDIFEAVVQRAATDALDDTSWSVQGQSQISGLVTGGTPHVRMYPDFVVRDDDGTVRLVGDAKWKTGRPRQADIYQMTSYQLADDVPGILVYPSQSESIETGYLVDDRLSLRVRELPTGVDATDFSSYTRGLSGALSEKFDRL